jgi:hypothetical protein
VGRKKPQNRKRLPNIITIVAEESVVAEANARLQADVFTAKLSADGNAPATHYWCSWHVAEDTDQRIRQILQDISTANRIRFFNGFARTPDDVLDQLNLQQLRSETVNG